MATQSYRPQHVPEDFRKVIGDMDGKKPWQPLLGPDLQGWSLLPSDWSVAPLPVSPDALPPQWQTIPRGVVGEDATGGTCLVAGDASWRDYEISLLITPLAGGNAQVFFRMDDQGRGCYVLDMMLGWQALDVRRLEFNPDGSPQMTRLSVVNFPLEHQREYAVSIAPRGQSITTYVDGALVNQVTDGVFPCGGVGLNVWHSKTLFRDVQVRHLDVPGAAG